MSPREILDFFKHGRLKDDLENGNYISICSIGDLLDVCESNKKRIINIDREVLNQRYRELVEDQAGPVYNGLIFIINLEQDNLSSALFEKEEELIIDLWRQAANANISPRRSIRYLTMRIIDRSTWWSEEVYLQMEEYHTSIG